MCACSRIDLGISKYANTCTHTLLTCTVHTNTLKLHSQPYMHMLTDTFKRTRKLSYKYTRAYMFTNMNTCAKRSIFCVCVFMLTHAQTRTHTINVSEPIHSYTHTHLHSCKHSRNNSHVDLNFNLL